MTTTTRAATTTTASDTPITGTVNVSALQRRRQLLRSVESLRERVRQVLKCVINLHIEFLVLESNVTVLLDEVRCLNDDFSEVERLDSLIAALRDYNGPTICHEWPYPLIFKGTIDKAYVAQILNTAELFSSETDTSEETKDSGICVSEPFTPSPVLNRRTKLWRFTRTRSSLRGKANGTISVCD